MSVTEDVQAIRRPSSILMWICDQCRYKHDEEKGIIEGWKEIIFQLHSKIEALEGGLRTIVAEQIARALGSGKAEERGHTEPYKRHKGRKRAPQRKRK